MTLSLAPTPTPTPILTRYYELLDQIETEQPGNPDQQYDIFLHIYVATPLGDRRLGFKQYESETAYTWSWKICGHIKTSQSSIPGICCNPSSTQRSSTRGRFHEALRSIVTQLTMYKPS